MKSAKSSQVILVNNIVFSYLEITLGSNLNFSGSLCFALSAYFQPVFGHLNPFTWQFTWFFTWLFQPITWLFYLNSSGTEENTGRKTRKRGKRGRCFSNTSAIFTVTNKTITISSYTISFGKRTAAWRRCTRSSFEGDNGCGGGGGDINESSDEWKQHAPTRLRENNKRASTRKISRIGARIWRHADRHRATSRGARNFGILTKFISLDFSIIRK